MYMNKKDDFMFPFSTCEKKKEGIAQPYSVFVNFISICIIFYFLIYTQNIYPFLLILSLLIFECVHTFSHVIHLESHIQNNITHCIGYMINIFFILTLYNYTNHPPHIYFLIYLLGLIIIDIYFFMNLSFMYYFSSSMIIFFSIFIYYYNYIPQNKKVYLVAILLLGLSIVVLLYNEKYNCKDMLSKYPEVPFHAFLELNGAFIFYFLCKFFYQM